MSAGLKRRTVVCGLSAGALLGLSFFGVIQGCKKAEPLPELGQVQAFALSDQEGRQVSLSTFAGKPWVAAFMFTRCPTVCPRITQAMKDLQAKAKAQNSVLHWVSFSVDPNNDTPEVLRAYAAKQGADLSNWSFLTGDSSVIQKTATDSFKMALEGQADPNKEHFGITHGSHLVLVDGRGAIRGFYRSSDEVELQRLLNELRTLLDN